MGPSCRVLLTTWWNSWDSCLSKDSLTTAHQSRSGGDTERQEWDTLMRVCVLESSWQTKLCYFSLANIQWHIQIGMLYVYFQPASSLIITLFSPIFLFVDVFSNAASNSYSCDTCQFQLQSTADEIYLIFCINSSISSLRVSKVTPVSIYFLD